MRTRTPMTCHFGRPAPPSSVPAPAPTSQE